VLRGAHADLGYRNARAVGGRGIGLRSVPVTATRQLTAASCTRAAKVGAIR
jgi:hypothetical protein